MEDMEVDGMEVDQGRRARAVEKLNGRLRQAQQEQQRPGLSNAQARDILKNLGELFTGGKITVDNAFDLQAIEALSTLVFTDRDAAARCGEGHFQVAGFGLDISLRIYGKRVDAVYNHAYKTLERKQPASKDNKDDDADDAKDQEGKEGGEDQADDEGEGNAGKKAGAKAKKRQGPSNSEATLAKDSDLRTRMKETTFDVDPFFVRTSRLIDENSPQGLLLHNLPVLYGSDVVFDANVRPQELLRKAQDDANVAGAEVDAVVDLSVLPYAREVLAAAARAPLSPGIEELYGLLEDRSGLPGLQVAASVDPQELLRKALAENKRERMQANRNAEVRQVVQQVEDAMDVDMADAADAGVAAGGDDGDNADVGDMGGDAAEAPGGGAGAAYAGDGGGDDGYYAAQDFGDDDGPASLPSAAEGAGVGGAGPRFGVGRAASDDEAPYGFGDDEGNLDDELVRAAEGQASDDASTLLSLLEGTAASSAVGGSSGALQRNWWRSATRRPTASTGAAARPRTRRPKPEEVPIDWHATPVPQLEDVRLHTYKTARRDASNKLCLPQEEPLRLEDLSCYFSSAPISGTLSLPLGGMGFMSTHGLGGGAGCGRPVQETWRATLIADNARERQRRREARAAEQQRRRSGAGPMLQRQLGGGDVEDADGGDMGGMDGAAFNGGGGEDEYRGDYGGGYDDGGAADVGGDFSDDESEEDSGLGMAGGLGGKAAGPTLEELLQPPRRVQRVTIKFDKTAGVADVATLKTNIEASLKQLAVSTVTNRRQSAPIAQPPTLSFQTVLDKVAEHAVVASQ
ncbi:hypothetical protein Agub_g14747, partial [Astrephomene gubernaculifera]